MERIATWTDEILNQRAHWKASVVRRIVLLAAFILALNLSATGWMYFQAASAPSVISRLGRTASGQYELDRNSVLLKDADFWTLRVLVWTSAGGAGFLMILLWGMVSGQRARARDLQVSSEEWQKTAARLEIQLAERRRNEAQSEEARAAAEQRAAEAEAGKAHLQGELDQLKRAEKNLSQRRQELESSKTVLELHVQTRTKELQKLQRRYELILNSAGEGICGLDLENRTTFVNPAVAKITGWSLEELIGKTDEEIFRRNGTCGQTEAGSQSLDQQIFFRKDGSSFPAELVKTPIDENGQMVGSVLVFKDITERKRVEESLAAKADELARSNAELEQFACVASHDVQEPLRKIQAFGDRLRAKCVGTMPSDANQYLERMQNAAARMRKLIDDLLTFSRVIRSSEPFVAVDLGALTKEVLSDLELRIEKTGARVEFGTLATIEADPMQMRQLLLNLIANALKFQPEGSVPVVKIHSRAFHNVAGEELCELSVEDNGIGFEEKYLEKIFAVFQRLHGRTEYEGTGVGLAVCRRITDRHRGTITARSQLGRGSTFMVTLPVNQTKPKAV